MNIEKKVKEIIEPTIIENNYILEGIEYVKEGKIYFLRVIIAKQGLIDVEDWIEENYILDVCSNGGYYE